ncbi:hypothetical protein BDP55DRAFT_624143 [Colletotrichum godetiae]|uniref:Uncharacterized protein n=1 Tax=Colletotrichum godetiae TaxID=1209918 RepID=A0AAJ0EL64_9PEZI|nr:uncharacterized protein BDP55DRAFT_624143 [Colletotrichum godetiae]KAK1657180.1 hypothetical protein BDP55DRAFT_624143 [Colletotrichum godetiae]
MGGFNKLTDLAQQLAGKDQGKKDKQQQDSSNSQTTTMASNDQEWADVGSAAKKALAGFQADQAGGKGPDYTEIGVVARRALTAYNHGGDGGAGVAVEKVGKKDLAEIGKGIAVGFGGSEKMEDGKPGGADGKLEAGKGTGGVEGERLDEGKETRVHGDDMAVSSSNAEDTAGLGSKKLLEGEESSTEKMGLGSYTKRDVGDGLGFEKGGLGEDEGVFTGTEGNEADVTRSGEATSGQGTLFLLEKIFPTFGLFD